jgi:excisionase family DNA binding protein
VAIRSAADSGWRAVLAGTRDESLKRRSSVMTTPKSLQCDAKEIQRSLPHIIEPHTLFEIRLLKCRKGKNARPFTAAGHFDDVKTAVEDCLHLLIRATVNQALAASGTLAGKLHTVAEAAEILGVKPRWSYHSVKAGRLSAQRFGKFLRFSEAGR